MASSEFYGLHRVVKPQGRAPQGAYSVRNEPRLLSPYEALLDVEVSYLYRSHLDTTDSRSLVIELGRNEYEADTYIAQGRCDGDQEGHP